MIAIKADTAALEMKLARLADAARVGLGPIIKQEGGNISRTIMLIVPPTTGKSDPSEASRPRGSGMSTNAKGFGENAIKGDLFGGKRKSNVSYSSIGLFQRIGGSQLIPPKRSRTETVRVRLGWEQSKSVRIFFKWWQPGASTTEMATFHKRYRNKYGRTGYVSRGQIGRWQVQDQMWVSNGSADAYFRLVASRVGWHKAGFASAAIACGIRVPAWIRRHAQAAGSVSANFQGSSPYIVATAKGVKIPDMQRYVDAAVGIRVKVTQQKIERLLSGKATNLGFAKVSAPTFSLV